MNADDTERAIPVDLGVAWSAGVSGAHLLQSEFRTFLTCYLGATDPAYTDVEAQIAIIEWHSCQGAVLGYPNDEGQHRHRLWNKGLREIGYYNAAEVQDSSWLAHLRRVASANTNYRPSSAPKLRHFVLLFHDSTFECLARGYTVAKVTRPMPDVLLELARRLWLDE